VRERSGKLGLVIGKATLQSKITLAEMTVCFAAIHLGDHNLSAGVREWSDSRSFETMKKDIRQMFLKGDAAGTMRLIEKHFESRSYSLWHLFKDEQRKILSQILDTAFEEVEQSLRRIREHHYPLLDVVRQMEMPLPRVFAHLADSVVDLDFFRALDREGIDLALLRKTVDESKKWAHSIDAPRAGYVAGRKIDCLMEQFRAVPDDPAHGDNAVQTLRILMTLGLELNLWKAQNIFFSIARERYAAMRKKADEGNARARKWCAMFEDLGALLNISVS
jgi:hypothetical protein